jgi:hypothetical protein
LQQNWPGIPTVILRRSPKLASAAALAVAAAGTVVFVALPLLYRAGAAAANPCGAWSSKGPHAVVAQPRRQLGIIETPEEFAQNFIISNQGDAPLALAQGPSTCKCTVTDLPNTPVAPGGQATIHVGFSAAVMHDTLKSGPFSRTVIVLSNDPLQPKIFLELAATVRRRLAAAPTPITLAIQSSDLPSPQKRSVETLVYSETWERFALAVVGSSRRGILWAIERAGAEELRPLQARSGYRLRLTLPADMPDGRFSETLTLAAKPAAAEKPRSLELQIQGSVDGRVTLFGPRVDDHGVLRLGILEMGQGTRQTAVMKVNDPCPTLTVRRIETEPDFLRVAVHAYSGEAASVGLYRIEVEIPPAAPAGSFMGDGAGVIRLRTDHPRLPLIECKVEFAKLSGPSR